MADGTCVPDHTKVLRDSVGLIGPDLWRHEWEEDCLVVTRVVEGYDLVCTVVMQHYLA